MKMSDTSSTGPSSVQLRSCKHLRDWGSQQTPHNKFEINQQFKLLTVTACCVCWVKAIGCIKYSEAFDHTFHFLIIVKTSINKTHNGKKNKEKLHSSSHFFCFLNLKNLSPNEHYLKVYWVRERLLDNIWRRMHGDTLWWDVGVNRVPRGDSVVHDFGLKPVFPFSWTIKRLLSCLCFFFLFLFGVVAFYRYDDEDQALRHSTNSSSSTGQAPSSS